MFCIHLFFLFYPQEIVPPRGVVRGGYWKLRGSWPTEVLCLQSSQGSIWSKFFLFQGIIFDAPVSQYAFVSLSIFPPWRTTLFLLTALFIFLLSSGMAIAISIITHTIHSRSIILQLESSNTKHPRTALDHIVHSGSALLWPINPLSRRLWESGFIWKAAIGFESDFFMVKCVYKQNHDDDFRKTAGKSKSPGTMLRVNSIKIWTQFFSKRWDDSRLFAHFLVTCVVVFHFILGFICIYFWYFLFFSIASS